MRRYDAWFHTIADGFREGGRMNKNEEEKVDALCPECGHAFKAFIDRVMADGKEDSRHIEKPCPVCGCGECHVGEQ